MIPKIKTTPLQKIQEKSLFIDMGEPGVMYIKDTNGDFYRIMQIDPKTDLNPDFISRFVVLPTVKDNTFELADIPKHEYSKKGLQWIGFSDLVLRHIEDYAIPQYGDFGDKSDQASQLTIEQIKSFLEKHVSRIQKNKRGELEDVRDCLKIAHYACFLHNILSNELKNKK